MHHNTYNITWHCHLTTTHYNYTTPAYNRLQDTDACHVCILSNTHTISAMRHPWFTTWHMPGVFINMIVVEHYSRILQTSHNNMLNRGRNESWGTAPLAYIVTVSTSVAQTRKEARGPDPLWPTSHTSITSMARHSHASIGNTCNTSQTGLNISKCWITQTRPCIMDHAHTLNLNGVVQHKACPTPTATFGLHWVSASLHSKYEHSVHAKHTRHTKCKPCIGMGHTHDLILWAHTQTFVERSTHTLNQLSIDKQSLVQTHTARKHNTTTLQGAASAIPGRCRPLIVECCP